MPQLDITTFTAQIFWLVVTFVVLYLVLARRLLPRIGEVIESRAKRIAEDIEQAEKLKAESEAAIKTYEAALAGARANAQTVIGEAKAAATAESAKALAALEARLDADASAAEARIRAARERAKDELASVAGEAASAIAKRLIGVDARSDAVAAVVAAELKRT
ncbi:MAG: F0F1 ATP synthase subunit B' [Alphaproteobacteria bacterium]|nr:F0F1 ATP synthase subunit B' [Alphaproteobacteria bacterium]